MNVCDLIEKLCADEADPEPDVYIAIKGRVYAIQDVLFAKIMVDGEDRAFYYIEGREIEGEKYR